MYRIGFGFFLALAGCAAPAPQTVLRDGSVAISSAALFDAARFAGDWHVVAAYGAEAGCGPLRESWAVTGPGRYDVTGTRCAALGLRRFDATAQISGPGRITLDGSEALWVLWVDADYRVAVIGTPSGAFGRIISRDKGARGDLFAAARDVLDFNGYDISGLILLN